MKNISFKAFTAYILSLVLVLSFSIGAFGDQGTKTVATTKTSAAYVEKLKTEVRALLDQMNSQCAQAKAYREKSVSREKAITQLLAAAKKTNNKKKLDAAKGYADVLKATNADIKSLEAINRDILIKAKYAKTTKDFESLKSSLTQTVATKRKLIVTLNTRLGLLDNIIAALRK